MSRNLNWTWYKRHGALFGTLILLYIILHITLPVGNGSYVNLSTEQIADVENIVKFQNEEDSVNSPCVADSVHLVLKRYFDANFELHNDYLLRDPESKLSRLDIDLRNFKETGYSISFISHLKIHTKSVFWLDSSWVYLEVIFWSIFGVICSLFFHISEAKKNNVFDDREQYVHIAKLVYTPVISLIIFFSLESLIGMGEVDLSGMKHGVLALSFTLGFFSGRAINLLNRIKEVILPAGAGDNSSNSESEKEESDFDSLSVEEQKELMKAAIIERQDSWINQFKFFDGGVSIAKKTVGSEKNQKTIDLYCLVFQVSEKHDNLPEESKIPEFINFQGYKIPTDIIVAGQTKTQNGNVEIGSNIGRINSEAKGTIGLKVYKKKNDKHLSYLLSCFHVLFPKELKDGTRSFKADLNSNQDQENIVVSKDEDQIVELGHVYRGVFDGEIDAGLVRLKEGIEIGTKIPELNYPLTIRHIKESDVDRSLTLQIRGYVSNNSKGYLISDFSSQPVEYRRGKFETIIGLIQTTRLSECGDSGAVVSTLSGEVVGILVGADDQFSYIQPIQKIINRFDIELNKDEA